MLSFGTFKNQNPARGRKQSEIVSQSQALDSYLRTRTPQGDGNLFCGLLLVGDYGI